MIISIFTASFLNRSNQSTSWWVVDISSSITAQKHMDYLKVHSIWSIVSVILFFFPHYWELNPLLYYFGDSPIFLSLNILFSVVLFFNWIESSYQTRVRILFVDWTHQQPTWLLMVDKIKNKKKIFLCVILIYALVCNLLAHIPMNFLHAQSSAKCMHMKLSDDVKPAAKHHNLSINRQRESPHIDWTHARKNNKNKTCNYWHNGWSHVTHDTSWSNKRMDNKADFFFVHSRCDAKKYSIVAH